MSASDSYSAIIEVISSNNQICSPKIQASLMMTPQWWATWQLAFEAREIRGQPPAVKTSRRRAVVMMRPRTAGSASSRSSAPWKQRNGFSCRQFVSHTCLTGAGYASSHSLAFQELSEACQKHQRQTQNQTRSSTTILYVYIIRIIM